MGRCGVRVGMAQIEVGTQRIGGNEAGLHAGAQVVTGRFEANAALALPPLVEKVLALLALQGLFLRGAQVRFMRGGCRPPEACLLVFDIPPVCLAIGVLVPGTAIPAQALYRAEPDGACFGIAGRKEVTGSARSGVTQNATAFLVETNEQDLAQMGEQDFR